jgi:TubC N-terminal docking domain
MLVAELLYRVAEHGVELRCDEGQRLRFSPPGALPDELRHQLKERKAEILKILEEDEEFFRTGIIQSERQAFELAREHFGLDEKGRIA